MFVKPGSGPSPDDPAKQVVFKVRNPQTRRFLAEAGEEVPNTPFWRRLLRDGDVVGLKPPAASAPVAEPAVPAAPTPAKEG